MANHDLTTGFSVEAFPYKGGERFYVQYRELDCATTNLTSGDDYNLMVIPEGALVLGVNYEIVTAEGAADSFDLGYTGALNTFYNDADANATAGTRVGTYVTPLYFTAEKYLTILANAALTAMKIRVYVVFADCSFT